MLLCVWEGMYVCMYARASGSSGCGGGGGGGAKREGCCRRRRPRHTMTGDACSEGECDPITDGRRGKQRKKHALYLTPDRGRWLCSGFVVLVLGLGLLLLSSATPKTDGPSVSAVFSFFLFVQSPPTLPLHRSIQPNHPKDRRCIPQAHGLVPDPGASLNRSMNRLTPLKRIRPFDPRSIG